MKLLWKASLILALVAPTAALAENQGWRTDGTGCYPDADPPTEWSPEKNVVWRTAMPGPSNSTPILVDGKLFVLADPDLLVCVRASDGELLWKKSNPLLDTFEGEQARAEAEARMVEARKLHGRIRKVRHQERKLRNQLKKAKGDAGKTGTLKKQVLELRSELKRLRGELEPIERYLPADTHKVNGHSSPTPASDGERVYVVFNSGVAAAYDLDGRRQWITFIARTPDKWGHSCSPAVVGGKVIVNVDGLVALSAEDGSVAWKKPAKRRYGSLVTARIGDVDVVLTPNGNIFRVADGERIGGGMGGLTYNSPVVEDGVAYYVQHKARAFRLPTEPADKVEPAAVWPEPVTLKKDRYYASPVMNGGMVYGITQKGLLSAIDAESGKLVFTQELKLPKTTYPSLTAAGGYVYASGDGGKTIVFKPEREFEAVAENELEAFRSCPVFVGKRMYVRTYKHLYCIGE
jgi:hypothetical protein